VGQIDKAVTQTGRQALEKNNQGGRQRNAGDTGQSKKEKVKNLKPGAVEGEKEKKTGKKNATKRRQAGVG